MQPEFSIVIPCYRSANTIESVVRDVVSVLRATGRSFEIILVDDGSPDDTWSAISQCQEAYPEIVTSVQLMRNFGQHNALMCGFRHARGARIITMDDDGQNPPSEIPKLIAAMDETGADLIYGSPEEKQHATWRNWGSNLVGAFIRLIFNLKCRLSSFRIIRRELVEAALTYNLNFTFVDGLLAWNTTRIRAIPVEHRARKDGRSGYSLWKLVTLSMNLFTNFSLIPLQLVSAIGIFVACCGLFGAVVYLSLYLTKRITVPGYASTILAILVMGGIQLLSVGVMGEYLGRLHLNVNRKPQYTIRNTRSKRARVENDSPGQN